MEQKPKDFETLLTLLQEAGYEVKSGKQFAFRSQEQKRFIRLDTLGEEYSQEALSAVLAGKTMHRPRTKTKRFTVQEEKQVNLLVDIQAKLQAGKGAGYELWAKRFNLKQMAQTMIYLDEHGLKDYDVLAEKTADASKRYRDLSAQIRTAEKRLAEIAVLRTHIRNYSKTRDVYSDYRQAGYSAKYRAEHEADILLHKAAKKAFDELGVKKLPTVKSLNSEYAELLAEKKAAYIDYHSVRDEIKELLTIKANVDRILEVNTHNEKREPTQGR